MAFKSDVLNAMFSRVLQETGISRREIVSEVREHAVIEARFAMYLALRKHGYSTPTIGKMLNRDHSTIVDGIRSARKRYEKSAAFRALVDKVVG